MKCLRSLVGVSRMDRVMNEEVRRRAGIERKLASREDQRVLKWRVLKSESMWKNWMSSVLPDVVDGRSQWGRVRSRETQVRLDGWCEGGLRHQRNDGGG